MYSTVVPALHLQFALTPTFDGEGVLTNRNGPD